MLLKNSRAKGKTTATRHDRNELPSSLRGGESHPLTVLMQKMQINSGLRATSLGRIAGLERNEPFGLDWQLVVSCIMIWFRKVQTQFYVVICFPWSCVGKSRNESFSDSNNFTQKVNIRGADI